LISGCVTQHNTTQHSCNITGSGGLIQDLFNAGHATMSSKQTKNNNNNNKRKKSEGKEGEGEEENVSFPKVLSE